MHPSADQPVVVFTRERAEGAWPNGTRVVKTSSAPDDTHGDGAVVIGSLGPSDIYGRKNVYVYFVLWDDAPGCPVAVTDYRLKRAS